MRRALIGIGDDGGGECFVSRDFIGRREFFGAGGLGGMRRRLSVVSWWRERMAFFVLRMFILVLFLICID